MEDVKQTIRTLALEMGFDDIGFCVAQTSKQHKDDLKEFNARELYGTMEWMQTTQERRADPKVLWPEAKSIIVLGMNYGPKNDPLALIDNPEKGVISCYAYNRDYHDTVKKRLKRLAREMVERWDGELKVFVDTAPVMEKPLAAQTQLGWQGKHTCVVSRTYGSWLFLGEIYTTLELEPDAPHKDHCGNCSSCLDICPTDAFLGESQIDGRKCISYLTIEHDGMIEPELALKMGNRIYGCDDCLAICPWTKFTQTTNEKDFKPRVEFLAPRLGDLIELDDPAFREFFRASPVKRIKHHRFIRNVIIAIVNSKRNDLFKKVEKWVDDDHHVIAQTAKWALSILEKG
ncbi:Epoxyqueuosine reductase [Candidatus Terasakiella magnetica]|uniref:Epoxyqueuosine reductase n=1 Tax=Candidatus Terasakiella magnetica TaxID=1867952 RepID=A0A1C3RJN8_9PROT|nr:tRNA epoxyqueuosine(34) reductase QueG [Candidatus Terasakiella magnetica]SCA57443.1 Epoxyqueuosine reductase [Candidatus Terasakiella magnetica]